MRSLSRDRVPSPPQGLQPLVLGHRGAPQQAPENTLASLRAAVALGADGVEFDVQLTRDGVPVLLHDRTVDRTTDGRGQLPHLTLAEVRRLDAGARFAPQFAGERIPTLAEALDLLAPSAGLINIEIKSGYQPSALLGERALVDRVLTEVRSRGLMERTLVSSFNPVALAWAKRGVPPLHTALNYDRSLPLPLARGWFIPVVRPAFLHPHYKMVTPTYIEGAHRRGRKVNTWTPNAEGIIAQLIAWGIDGLITDRPELALRLRDRAS